jgi:glycerol-3-phosphate dehydrogenase
MILRDLNALDGGRFDIAIVGGGIHGAMLALEASRRGLSVALVERGDFGAGSTGNSLRILHGGLRCLQSADFPRFRESVRGRKWYARHFPRFVRPLPCLMPLYGQGVKRAAVMRIAVAMNDALSIDRNTEIPEAVHLPDGSILDRAETISRFPSVRTAKLEGACLWYDYQMISSERLVMETLRAAASNGAVIANYVEATEYVSERGRMRGIVCSDAISERKLSINASVVVNCAGAAASALAIRAGCADAKFAPASAAFNVLFESSPMGASAMAVAAPEPGAPVLFVCPARSGLWAGTAHFPREPDAVVQAPGDQEVEQFISALRRAVPAFDWTKARVRKIFWGVLPVKQPMTVQLTVRPEVLSHGAALAGLYSVVGIKFTTAPLVANAALQLIFGGRLPAERSSGVADARGYSTHTDVLIDGDLALSLEREKLRAILRAVATEEGVVETEDLLLRRTNWMFTATDLPRLRSEIDAALRPAAAGASTGSQQSA